MKVEQIPITQIRPNPWNPNSMNGRMRRATREAIETYGFVLPVLVRVSPLGEGLFEIVDGEHRWREAGAAGYAEIPAVVGDWDDVTAKKLTVILGEIEGEADPRKLGGVLAEIAAGEGEDFSKALPYTEAELDALLAYGPHALEAGEQTEWRTLSAQVPREFLAVYQAVEEKVGALLAQDGKALHPKRAVRRGQVLEILAAEYLAAP